MQIQENNANKTGANSSINTTGNEFLYNSSTNNQQLQSGDQFAYNASDMTNNKVNSLLGGDRSFYLN